MSGPPDILCIGAVLWDVIGRAASRMQLGDDVAGHITRLPGGVALNIAVTLRRAGMQPALLGVTGADVEGDALIAACAALGLNTGLMTRAADLPTDRYMAIEDETGLIAAIADAHSLERAGARIWQALVDGTLGSAAHPYPGLIALDGNLTTAQLAQIAASACFASADLRVAPASPGKAERLRPLLTHPRATLYVNLSEAGILCDTQFHDSGTAARALIVKGATRVVVTDGARATTDAARAAPDADPVLITQNPPAVRQNRVTGAGDTFMAAHIAAEHRGACRDNALRTALHAAAEYVATGYFA